MKAVISNRIYLEVDGELSKTLREKLTYQIPTYGDGPPITIQNYSVFRPGLLTIPSGRVDLIPDGYEIVDKRVFKPVVFPPFRMILRDSQQEIHDEVDDNAMINAKVGWGKTFCALAIAAKLGQKTVIVVHNLTLMHQWKDEVKKVFGFTPGLIGDGHYNTKEIITIANIASLYKRMGDLGKEFGTVIQDECHKAPAPSFSKVLDRSYARYKIGLSGTLKRKDGLHVLLPDYFGHKIFKPPPENTMTPSIHVYDTGLYFPFGNVYAHRVSQLLETQQYQELVVRMVEKYKKLGHKVLIVADRIDFLKIIAARTNSALIIGETKDREAQFASMSEDKDSLCGTLSIFKEGISYNPLSVVILAVPISNDPMLEQLIGRIQRMFPGKLNPIVVDLLLRGHTTEKQFTQRAGFYLREGFEILYQ